VGTVGITTKILIGQISMVKMCSAKSFKDLK